MSVRLMQAEHNLKVAGVRVAVFEKLLNLSSTSVSNIFRGFQHMSAEKELELLQTTERLVAYQKALLPLSLPRDWQDLKALLDANVPPDEVEQGVAKCFGRG